MAQFDIHQNRNAATRTRYPYLLDIQSDLLESLATRVVIPLTPLAAGRTRSMDTLTPHLKVGGKSFVALTPQLAAISRRELGPAVTHVGGQRTTLIAALDLLITGI